MLRWLTIYQHGGGARRLNIFWAQSIPKLCAFLSAARLSEPLLIILLFCLLPKRSCDFGYQRSNSTFSKEWGSNMQVGQALHRQPPVDGDDAIDDGNVMTPVLNDLLQRMFPNVSLLWRKLLPAACYLNSSHSHTEKKISATISSRWGSIFWGEKNNHLHSYNFWICEW